MLKSRSSVKTIVNAGNAHHHVNTASVHSTARAEPELSVEGKGPRSPWSEAAYRREPGSGLYSASKALSTKLRKMSRAGRDGSVSARQGIGDAGGKQGEERHPRGLGTRTTGSMRALGRAA
eukprot:1190011-Rhodomonas_salina.1